MSSFKAVLWDMDGTLIDSEILYTIGLEQVNSKYQLTYDVRNRAVGESFEDLWQKMNAHESVGLAYDRWVDELQKYMSHHVHHLEIFDSARTALTQISHRQLMQACVSNNNKGFIDTVLSQNNVKHLFEHWLGQEDVALPKPHPEPYQHSARLLNLDPSQCLVIEDSAVGTTSAKLAGMKVALYCPMGLNPITDKADYIIRDHSEILNLIGR